MVQERHPKPAPQLLRRVFIELKPNLNVHWGVPLFFEQDSHPLLLNLLGQALQDGLELTRTLLHRTEAAVDGAGP